MELSPASVVEGLVKFEEKNMSKNILEMLQSIRHFQFLYEAFSELHNSN